MRRGARQLRGAAPRGRASNEEITSPRTQLRDLGRGRRKLRRAARERENRPRGHYASGPRSGLLRKAAIPIKARRDVRRRRRVLLLSHEEPEGRSLRRRGRAHAFAFAEPLLNIHRENSRGGSGATEMGDSILIGERHLEPAPAFEAALLKFQIFWSRRGLMRIVERPAQV